MRRRFGGSNFNNSALEAVEEIGTPVLQYIRKSDSIRIVAIIHALRSCFLFSTPRFRLLARLPESEPDPRTSELVTA